MWPKLRSKGQGAAAETVLRDWEDFVTFYHYPKEHWVHLRTSNPMKSIFSGVRLRTNAARRIRSRENALYLVFKLVERLSGNWRTQRGRESDGPGLGGMWLRDGILKRAIKTTGWRLRRTDLQLAWKGISTRFDRNISLRLAKTVSLSVANLPVLP